MKNVIEEIVARGGEVYEVGGCVRDSYMGRPAKDTDYLVCKLPMDTLVYILSKHGRVDCVGQSFGVIKFKYRGEIFDFALPRTEESTGNGHRDFVVKADHRLPVEEDLARRDFTINAIARNALTGAIVDPYGGIDDIKNRLLRAVSPRMTFLEDPLRILRGIQFAARFEMGVPHDTYEAMREHGHLLSTISPERISMELAKLLAADQPSIGFRLMHDLGILRTVLPELADLVDLPQPKKYHMYDVFNHSLHAMDAAVYRNENEKVYMRFAALVHDFGKAWTLGYKEDGTPTYVDHAERGVGVVNNLITRLKFTSVPGLYFPVDRILKLVEYHMFECDCESSDKSIRKFISHVGKDLVMDLLRLRIADRCGKGIPSDIDEWVRFAKKVRKIASAKAPFNLKDLAVNGHDLIAAGMKPGKEMGAALNRLMGLVLEDPSLNDKATLLKLAAEN